MGESSMTLEISHPWACAATTAPGIGGGFFTLENKGSEGDRLVAASTPAAESVEIHAIRVVGANIKMQLLETGLAFPAHTTITLKPRGYHLLLKGLKAPLFPGVKLPVTLTFEKAGARDVEMVVEPARIVGVDVLNESLQPG
jgi:copper(I)-binding protein